VMADKSAWSFFFVHHPKCSDWRAGQRIREGEPEIDSLTNSVS
jgi:hypothetical protein